MNKNINNTLIFLILFCWITCDCVQANQNWLTIIYELEQAYANNKNNSTIKTQLAQAYNNYGLELGDQKEYKSAVKYLKQALFIAPDNELVKKNYSFLLYEYAKYLYENHNQQVYEINRYSEPQKLLEEALQYNMENAHALALLGEINYANQELDKAELVWKKALSLQPNNPYLQDNIKKLEREREGSENMADSYNRYFKVQYDKNLKYRTGFDISMALNQARVNVSRLYQYSQKYKIPVLIYEHEKFFVNVQGASHGTQGQYDGKIRIPISTNRNYDSRISSVIVHEYTHAVIDDITNANCPRWFNEGLAEYSEYKYGITPSIHLLQQDIRSKKFTSWDKLDDMFFSSDVVTQVKGYQYAYSIIRFMNERYGISRILKILHGLEKRETFEDLIKANFYQEISSLEKKWQSWVLGFRG